MKTKKQIVRLREKEISNGNKSLFLDITWNGKRSKEYLKMYIVPPKTTVDRELNKQTLTLAAYSCAKRTLILADSGHRFLPKADSRPF